MRFWPGSRTAGGPAWEDPRLEGAHLLLLPAGTDPADIERLVLAHTPDALDGEPGLRLGRYTRLLGPLPHHGAPVPLVTALPGWRLAYALYAPAEREGPPLLGLPDRQGYYRAFADGLPTRAERRALDLMLALARRLGGGVLVAASGVLLRPEMTAVVDVVVHADRRLEPDETLALARAVVPAARLALDAAEWQGPPPGVVDSPDDAAAAALRPSLRVALHGSADRLDARAAQREVALDGYAVAIGMGPDDEGGLVEVRVRASHPPTATAYEVRWWPPDPAQAEHDDPGPEHRTVRAAARGLVRSLAAALVVATGGKAVDGDGLPVDITDSHR